jgi:hypothetical protein
MSDPEERMTQQAAEISTKPESPVPVPMAAPSSAHFAKVLGLHHGLVVKVESRTIQSTWRSGGGSYTGAGGAVYTDPVREHTTNHLEQTIWLRDEGGNDWKWYFFDQHVGALEGHRALVIYDRATERPLRFVNRSVGRFWRMDIEDPGFVRGVFQRLFACVSALLMSLPGINFIAAFSLLRRGFGKKSRWYSTLPVKLCVALFGAAVFLSYGWIVPLLDPSPDKTITIPAPVMAQVVVGWAKVIGSQPFEWGARKLGADPYELSQVLAQQRLIVRDAAWLEPDEFAKKHAIGAEQLDSKRYLGLSVIITALGSLAAFPLGLVFLQLKLTATSRCGSELDRLARAHL